MNEKGFSLVELLVAMAIASVLGMAGVALFATSNWTYKVNEDVSEAQQNVRVGMEWLAKDIRTAGFGLPDPPLPNFTFTVPTTFIGSSGTPNSITLTSPITVTTSGGTANPDALTILGIGYEAGILSKGAAPDCNDSGMGKICLNSVDSANNFFNDALTTFKTNRKYISLNGTTYIELSNTQTERASAKLALGTPAALDRTYPDGTPVFIIQAVQYSIENDCTVSNPCYNLKSNDATDLRGSGRQVVAENIEDLQFAYGIDVSPRDGKIDYTGSYATASFVNAPIDNTSIVAVRANVVAKTSNIDVKGGQFTRPAVEDHAAATSKDGYRRRLLTRIIKLRNPRSGGS